MTELPGTAWTAAPLSLAAALAQAPLAASWRAAGQATHGFTHFELILDVYTAQVDVIHAEGFLRPAQALAAEATAIRDAQMHCRGPGGMILFRRHPFRPRRSR